MSLERICAYLGLAIAVVALIWDQGLDASEHRERGYLIRNASFVLTMDPSLGDRMGHTRPTAIGPASFQFMEPPLRGS